MSFILDALKKSENERQRQIGPGMFQPRLARRRSRLPAWAIAIAALLGVNLLLLIWLTTRPGDRALPSGAAVAPPAVSAPAVEPPTAPAKAAAPVVAIPPTGAATPFNPPLIIDPALSTSARSSAPAGAAANPNDYLPAQPPAATAPVPPASVGAGPLGMPTTVFATRESLLARGLQVPEVSLSLHVYDIEPARRFVFLNGQRGVEGETLPNGLRIEQIVPEGVVLSSSGNRFLVPLQ